MHAPRRRRRVGRGACALLALLLAATTVRAADEGAPTPEARAAYWIDRLVAGPEATTWAIPDFHQGLLLDAERNLVALGPATLDRLADPDLVRRVQQARDANPWHEILAVLRRLGPSRPEVARAWAVPAVRHDLLTLRRAALPVLAVLRDPADGPVLADVLARDVADRMLGPLAVEALLTLGAPWDAAAVRGLYERGVVDQPGGVSSLWRSWPAVAAARAGSARDDVLAWWALLAEASGPRVPDVTRTGRHVDLDRLRAVPLADALPQGREAAALARARLASSGHAPARASVAEDLASGDETLVRAARGASLGPATEAGRAAVLAAAAGSLAAWRAGRPVPPAAVADQVRGLADDPSAEATALLRDLLRTMPAAPAWREPLLAAYAALGARGQEDAAFVEEHLRRGTPPDVDLALVLARGSASVAVLDVLERVHDAPAPAALLPRLRREIAFVYGRRSGDLAPERVAAFARRLAGWAEDPADPSGAALAGTLTDLGPAGERVLAAGLRGAHRETYLAVLRSRASRYLGPDVVAALVEPVGRDTPVAERRRVLEAVLACAGSDALGALDALSSRLLPDGRADVAVVRGIVRWRTPSPAGG